ncbi:dipeptidyl aminopeptidase/acylaminoacyl peptidase [Xylaria cf. heliscus]|nr:dipeptidyl aminopeptidase/acylaminoacyl peptidase [Xylaria cf. heliscus]
MYNFYKGTFFNFESIRVLATTRHGGADVGEFLEALGTIKDNDPVSWNKAWAEQARKAEELALEAAKHGQKDAARMAFLRASNYARATVYMMLGVTPGKSNPRTVPGLHKSVQLFRKAVNLMDHPVHILEIPYRDGVSLPAYLHLPTATRRLPGKIPLLINALGADAMQEEIYYAFPSGGVELGYAVLTYEGPGQGLTLHENNVTMRPDWESVSRITLDYIFQYAKTQNIDLDSQRVAVAGASLGAYFALRSAADPRIKACVAVDPLYNLFEVATRHASPTFLRLWESGWIPDSVVNNMMWFGARYDFQLKWELTATARFMGVSTPTELLRAMKKYTLEGANGGTYLDKIKCPVLVTGASNSLYFDVNEHSAQVFNRLSISKKELWVATTPGDGSLQAKIGAFGLCNQRVFTFLDTHFGIKRGTV